MTSTTTAMAARATDVHVGRDYLEVGLNDGRLVKVPIDWFPRLAAAGQKERRKLHLIGRGIGIRWDDLDEDVSVENLLVG